MIPPLLGESDDRVGSVESDHPGDVGEQVDSAELVDGCTHGAGPVVGVGGVHHDGARCAALGDVLSTVVWTLLWMSAHTTTAPSRAKRFADAQSSSGDYGDPFGESHVVPLFSLMDGRR